MNRRKRRAAAPPCKKGHCKVRVVCTRQWVAGMCACLDAKGRMEDENAAAASCCALEDSETSASRQKGEGGRGKKEEEEQGRPQLLAAAHARVAGCHPAGWAQLVTVARACRGGEGRRPRPGTAARHSWRTKS